MNRSAVFSLETELTAVVGHVTGNAPAELSAILQIRDEARGTAVDDGSSAA